MIPLELIATFIIAGSLEIIIPSILGLFLWIKLKADWRVWGVGAGMFIISLIRIPLNSAVSSILYQTFGLTQVWLLYAFPSLTAGIFEETARYISFRYIVKERDMKTGLMYGAGHGGIESIALVGISVLSSVYVIVYQPHLIPIDQLNQIYSMPTYLPLIGLYERLMTMIIHIALSLMVLECFRRRDIRYLGAAIILHFLMNFTTTFIGGGDVLVSEMIITGWAIGGVLYIRGLWIKENEGIQPVVPTIN